MNVPGERAWAPAERPGAWRLLARDGEARAGLLLTRRGVVRTPAFAPVATRGTIKGVRTCDLPRGGFDLLLSNTYHLWLRPGVDTVAALGGIQRLLDWPGPVLTDSGGFQVFSLAAMRDIHDHGVRIRSHIDGALVELTPESVIAAQETMGSDIAMVLDVCPALPSPAQEIARAVERTARWAQRCRAARRDATMALFGIVQGGTDPELRRRSAAHTVALDFDGYAVGGLSVGETASELYRTLDATVPHLPADRVRYLMGVGRPDNLVEAVARGIDLFDCVLPTRNARNGKLFTWDGFLNIKRAEFARDDRPLDPRCTCPTCLHISRGTLRHLHNVGEMTFATHATVHNLAFMAQLMQRVRTSLCEGGFDELRRQVVACYATDA